MIGLDSTKSMWREGIERERRERYELEESDWERAELEDGSIEIGDPTWQLIH